jgi:thiol-disulfide isomerase/thioredoxin
VMLFPRLSNWFAQAAAPVANLGQRLQGKEPSSGFGGGVVFGAALGLLWTPCAGPILAAITTLVATHAVNLLTVMMTIAYSIGAGIPMFLIAYGGSRMIQSSRFLSMHAEGIRQIFGCLMMIVALVLMFHWDMVLEQKLSRFFPPSVVELQQRRGNKTLEPEMIGITGWINSPPLTLKELRGKVVLIDFWTYSCINCLRTLPYLEKWYADYKDQGLVIIGVHTPEFEFEKDPQNVAAAVKRLGIDYPIALDNNYQTWQAFHNDYWPAHYLIDQEGNIRLEHFGEGDYMATENAIRDLLGLAPLNMPEVQLSTRPISHETYLGAARGHSYAMPTTPGVAEYHYTQPLGDDEVGLKGRWLMEQEYITPQGDDCYLSIYFLAKEVYLVLSGSSKEPVEVFLDGNPAGEFYMAGDKKYDIVRTTYQRHQLSLKIPPGVHAYAFTFGDE